MTAKICKTTKMGEAIYYFDSVVREVDQVLTASQQGLADLDNEAFLLGLVARLRRGWDVLGNQIIDVSLSQV